MDKIIFTPGSKIEYQNQTYIVTDVLDFNSILVRRSDCDTIVRLRLHEILEQNTKTVQVENQLDIAEVSEKDWLVAEMRLKHISPLLLLSSRTYAEIDAVAQKANVHRATIFRWLKCYEESNLLSSLLPIKKSGGRGRVRLCTKVEDVIKYTIEDLYLTTQKQSVQKTCDEVLKRCKRMGVQAPHQNTVRNRVRQITEKDRIKNRFGPSAADKQFRPITKSFPGAKWPLSVVQIDHTLLDIILVDDVDRMPIGRPWITLAIDVFSRMVAGFYVSFDPPGAASTGLCLGHAILPKEEWLAKRKIDSSWPLWGIMDVIHLDNAKEFRGSMLERACQEYGIDIHWRPVARPQYGGHIERLLGTFNGEIHNLAGTTFSNIVEREGYKSDKNASLTLSEFEQWLVIYITKVYHQKLHKGIETTPLLKFEEGIFGSVSQPGRGLPSIVSDVEKLKYDFMPLLSRTVQQYGLLIDEIFYYHDVLRPWINAKEPGKTGQKRAFTVRRDPRDISHVYFFDPEIKQYFEIPYRDASRPLLSLWELRAVRKKLRDEGKKNINEDAIFSAYEDMHRIESESKTKTRSTRRAEQRKRHNSDESNSIKKSNFEPAEDRWSGLASNILPFDEIDVDGE